MKRYILVIAAVAAFASSAFAQNSSLFNSYTDPVSAALGGATAALEADAYAVTNNPAAMSLYDGKAQAGVSYGSWAPKLVRYGAIGAAGFFKAGKFAVGADFKYFMEPEIEKFSFEGAPMGTFKPQDLAVTIGASYGIGDKLSVGVAGKMISSTFNDKGKSASEFGADVMAMFKTGGLTASAGVCNLGSSVGAAKVGAAYSIAGFTATADGQYIFKGGYTASVGAQYNILGIVTPRLGYHLGNGYGAVGSFFSAGLGVSFKMLRVNASYFFGDAMGNTFSAGLGLAF